MSAHDSDSILIVDDEPPVRRMVHLFLELAGFRVLEASNGAEALELLDAHTADIGLLLTDLNMPGINGIELATQVRRLRPDLPVVFLSGNLGQFRALPRPSGCLSIDKPFRAGELIRCIRKALATAHQGEPSRSTQERWDT